MKFKLRLLQIFFIFLINCSFLIGCASLGTFNPATGKSELIFIPTSEEVSMGKTVHETLSTQHTLSEDKLMNERLQRVGKRVAASSDRQDYEYKFFLVESDTLNAFTTPGGNIYMYTGLMSKLTTDDELAAVLAHEVGHCAAKHTIKKFQKAMGYNILASIALSQIGAENRGLASYSANAIMNVVSSAYSRKDEYEADKLAIKYTQIAGYDPQGVADSFKVLQANTKGPRPPEILSSHPHLEDRIKAVESQIKSIKR